MKKIVLQPAVSTHADKIIDPASWVTRLAESDSRLHKESVLSQALSLAQLGDYSAQVFLGLVKATYNPYVTFGIKQVPQSVGISDAPNPWQEFNQLLLKLSGRQITGNAARDALDDMCDRFDTLQWETLCAPVIKRDLRAGISDKTINKICKGTEYEIPVFGCQLATSSDDRPEMSGKKRLEPKLDGVRVLMTVIPDEFGGLTVISMSRNGKPFDNFTHIEQEIERDWLKMVHHSRTGASLANGFVLDGEIVGNSFNQLMRQARRKDNVQAHDTVFHVFDIIPLADFRRGHWNAQLHKRIDILENMNQVFVNMNHVRLLPHIDVDLDTAEGRDVLQRYAVDQVAAGYEGIMIKDVGAPYECKRNTFWMKWKPTITVDLEVTDVEEGTGRNLGRLGALVCNGVDHGKTISVNCGSGFSDSDRDTFWADRGVVIGRTVEILADAISQNQDGTYSLRFPRFLRFRDDK